MTKLSTAELDEIRELADDLNHDIRIRVRRHLKALLTHIAQRDEEIARLEKRLKAESWNDER